MSVKVSFFAVLLVFTSMSIKAQCKGFEIKSDPFLDEIEMRTLWIENSVKMKSPKVKYRLELENSSTYLYFKFLTSKEVFVSEGDRLIFLSTEGDKINLVSSKDVKGEESSYAGIPVFENNVKCLITLEQLEIWTDKFTQARIYFEDYDMTFPFDQKKNYQLFHEAKGCYLNKMRND